MLKISAMQMGQFSGIMRDRFELAAVGLLRREFPELAAKYPDEHLRRFVVLGIENANEHGIVAVSDVEEWLRLMVRLGPRFDTDARFDDIRRILAERDLPAPYRLERISRLVENSGAAPG